jgi:two-component system, NarL family, nitrate/nitrite response regulator NarL
VKIVFADDHTLIRESVSVLLRKLSSDTCIFEADNFDDAFAIASDLSSPDLIILDLFMPGMNHLSGIAVMRRHFPQTPIVILTGAIDMDDAYRALEHGANGYIPKTIGQKAMLSALRLILEGERFLPSQLVAQSERGRNEAGYQNLAYPKKNNPLRKLTPREREVLSHLTGGLSNKEIARKLGLQEITIKVHLKGVYRKLNVSNRTQAVTTALKLGGSLHYTHGAPSLESSKTQAKTKRAI